MRSCGLRAPLDHSIEPESGRKIPVIIRMVVVLPAPLRPRRPVIVPCLTEKETPSTARTALNVFTISRTERTSVIRRLPSSKVRRIVRVSSAQKLFGNVDDFAQVEDLTNLSDDSTY